MSAYLIQVGGKQAQQRCTMQLTPINVILYEIYEKKDEDE